MKGAFKGEIVSESVGLKSKMYFSVSVDGKKIKKTKGVNENIAKNTRHKEFADVLFNEN